ncbi:leucine-rich repeat protein [Butyrivibrio sp. VCD2006]|uniref:leucine-rich repeat protein n=1 Tax=Butyrivibrio sp. VCD2006 TaxID=1280664 RepID=UPI0003F8C88D|nr:DUF6273 domain-containing protein [Butyrivibrio sp. VCD2006]
MRKKLKRFFRTGATLLLSAALIAMPIPVFGNVMTAKADEGFTKRVVGMGIGGLGNPEYGGGGWYSIYYGKYNGEPVIYNILDNNSIDYTNEDKPTLLLDCNAVLFEAPFDKDFSQTKWAESQLKTYLNDRDFLNKEGVFTDIEKEAIVASTKSDLTSNDRADDMKPYNYKFAPLRNTKIFVLDAAEVANKKYGFNQDAMTKDITRVKYNHPGYGYKYKYWLRSGTTSSSNKTWVVSDDGGVVEQTYPNSSNKFVSPAFNIDKRKIVMTSLIGGTGADRGGIHKLTLLDEFMSTRVTQVELVNKNEVYLKFNTTGAHSKNADRYSVVLVNDKDYELGKSYSRNEFSYNKLEVLQNNGNYVKAKFELPYKYQNLEIGEDYVAVLFMEDVYEDGSTDYASKPEIITSFPEKHDLVDHIKAIPATCTEEGHEEYYQCLLCGGCYYDVNCTKLADPEDLTIKALGHEYGEPEYLWRAVFNKRDGKLQRICRASATCKHEGCTEKITEEGKIKKEIVKEATTTENGIIKYTATFKNELFTTQEKEFDDIPMHVHNLTEVPEKAPTCEEDGNIKYYYCEECGMCFADEEGTTVLEKDDIVIHTTGHDYGDAVYEWSADGKTCVGKKICKKDPTHIFKETGEISSEVIKKPTNTEKGVTRYRAIFETPDFETQYLELEDIPALGGGEDPEPGTPDPGTPDPVTPDPETPDPGTPDPGTPDPGTPDPETPDPGAPDPGTPDPGTPGPGTPDPETPDPGTPDPETPDPGAPDPGTPDPGTPEPGTPDPGTPDPETPDPGTPDPGTPDPGTPDPETPDPGIPDPGIPDPGTPEPTTPEPTTPEPTTPEPTTPVTPQENPTPVNSPEAPATGMASEGKVGDSIVDQGSNATYTITSTETNNLTVIYNKSEAANAANATIPEEITSDGKNYKVTEIAAGAFKNNKKLKKITISKNIIKIGANAFNGCSNLKTVNIKTTALKKNTVGKNAFKGIHAKAKVKVPGKKLKAYKTILKAKGIKGKTQKITK